MRAVLDDFKASLKTITAVSDSLASSTDISSEGLKKSDAISCGSVLLLTGNFESFLKGVVKAFIRELNDLNKPLEKIPESMLHAHFHKGGLALGQYIKQVKKGEKDISEVEGLSDRLASVSSPTGGYTLVWEAFTDTRSNPGPDVVKSLLGDVGIADVWRQINGLAGRGPMDLFLTSFIAKRNVVAHTGAHPSPPTGSELFTACDNFECIAVSVFLLLEDRLSQIAAL